MTERGFARADYTRVFDGRAMKRPQEERKLERIRAEVSNGATQWVLATDQPKLVETLLTCLFEPTESERSRTHGESLLRQVLDR